MIRTMSLLLALLSLACGARAAPQLQLRAVATGFSSPVSVVAAHDHSGRLFVVEQRGKIRVLRNGAVEATPLLDVSTLISCCGERGLLGLAFHPRFASNGRFFVNYTDKAGDTNVVEFRSSGGSSAVDPASGRLLLRIAQPFSNHNGGNLTFGPDGFLYIGMGDGGSGGDPGNRAQDLSTLLGKMLRIDVDGALPYAIPPDNPFVGRNGARGEIWAYGLRNPWRFSFDRETGELWISDVGQDSFEEIDRAAAGGGGQNYGWRKMEGTHCFNPSSGCADSTLTLPVLDYSHADGCSVTGGYVYRGVLHPQLRGTYLFGDFCSGNIFRVSVGTGAPRAELLLSSGLAVSTFGEDESGELYVADYNSGTIYLLDDLETARKRPVHRRG